ncbi:Acyl-coenzyme A:6-aminopenicillanic acid acyl-transferase [Oceanospirillum multiglobuliferum]|uniref:Peptidase C45 hydrolase domain-containing protein n=1 Tax=Oceanospirillum multiglobuliferum TaxID=64969 RepID=A0A1T4PB25_9GAMM|nr:C45 family peptidase [Oceanospirillum multiglobuliferum]OPX55622.1 hypothetical protein BTE48_08405 [Oceanospirillum multiglobuliferum]SJZ88765.1 Acyl-coenzyme A:6-aminopenicillanic acid acyl-transferase [Oceanospirillum multiglobuliferum]
MNESFQHSTILSKGSIDNVQGVKIIKLSGNSYEIGFQHGYLLADNIRLMIEQTLPAAAAVIAKTLHSDFDTAFEKMQRAAKLARPYLPEELVAEMRGIADGANAAGYSTNFETIQLWNTMYDQWCIYAHPHYWDIDNPERKGQYPNGKAGTHVLAGAGCSSFSAWDESAGGDGKLIFCKNEDNLNLPAQLENRYLFVVNPDIGNAHLYLCFPGMIGMDGGFNDKGITMMTQYSASIHETMEGCGIGVFTRLLLTHANNLDEAKQVFFDHPRCTGIAYHCADAINKKACVVETSAKMVTVRDPMPNFSRLWQANDSICYPGYQAYYGYNMVADQQLVYELADVSSIQSYLDSMKAPYNMVVPAPCRFERYDQLLQNYYGEIDVNAAISIVSDRFDPYTKMTRPKDAPSYTNNIMASISAKYPEDLFTESPNGSFKAGVANLWSLIAYPETGDFWLAIEDFPANQGEFHQFNLNNLLGRK